MPRPTWNDTWNRDHPSRTDPEEVISLIEMGLTTHQICETLKTSPGAVSMKMRRSGHVDIARRFTKLETQLRKRDWSTDRQDRKARATELVREWMTTTEEN